MVPFFFSFFKIFFQMSSDEIEEFHDHSTNAINISPILKKNTSHVKIKSFHWRSTSSDKGEDQVNWNSWCASKMKKTAGFSAITPLLLL